MKKTANTFASYQEQKQLRREGLIEAYLRIARKSRQKYDYVTDLAKAVAMHITTTERREGVTDAACNPSTLLRNRRYKSLLLSYLADSASPGLKNTNKPAVLPGAAEASNALLSQLEISNLRLENQRLKYHIAELEKEVAAKGTISIDTGGKNDNDGLQTALSELEFKYVSTCQTVMALLTRLQDILALDMDKKCILDASVRRGDNVIVEERLAEPFFEWLKKHAASI